MNRRGRYPAVLLALLSSVAIRAANGQPFTRVLFDFESGIDGWHGNAWGGGTCSGRTSDDAAVGSQALLCCYEDVEKGSNLISPSFPAEAPWRSRDWGYLTFWAKGDGSAGEFRIVLECAEAEHSTYSRTFSMHTDSWTRYSLPLGTLWNRGGKHVDIAKLKRLYVSAKGTHTIWVDHLSLQASYRAIPLTPLPAVCVPESPEAPILDGRADEPCWKNAAYLPPFQLIDGREPAKETTECVMFHHGGRLFIHAAMRTAHPDRIRATLNRHDAPIYTDDAFEVFIGSVGKDAGYAQFVVNPLGATFDLNNSERVRFEHDWESAVLRTDTGWAVELSIDLASLLDQAGNGSTFALNVCRENRVNGELSCWAPTGASFLNSGRFGQALLVKRKAGKPQATAARWVDFGAGWYGVTYNGQSGFRAQQAHFRFGSRQFFAAAGDPPTGVPGVEQWLPIRVPLAEEGWARVVAVLGNRDGSASVVQAGRFQIFQPVHDDPPSPVPIIPSPKSVVLGEGVLQMPNPVAVHFEGRPDPRNRGWLAAELKRWHGIQMVETQTGSGTIEIRRVAGIAGQDPLLPEGYRLAVSPKKVEILAIDDRGCHYGILTLLQLLRADTSLSPTPSIRCCRISDHPSLTWRSVRIGLPTSRWGYPNNASVDVDFFGDFIERSVVSRKLNMVIFEVNSGLRYMSHPEIGGPAAWTTDDLRKVIALCRTHFIEPVPLVNSYGHTGYLTLRHPELREDGRLNTICTRNPETWALLTDIYSELLELFSPVRFFHVGLDEIRWQTLDVPEEKRCPLCAGATKADLLAEHVKRMRDWFHERDVRIIMWGDHLLTEHNGGAPYHTAEALTHLPRDVIVANWSTSLAPTSNARFHGLGFTVWQSNSRGVNREQAGFCEGNMFGAWGKRPWLTDSPWRSAQQYNALSFVVAAEYSWNLWGILDRTKPGLSTNWFRRREQVLATDALDPVPTGAGDWMPLEISPNLSSKGSTPAGRTAWFGAAPAHDLRHLPRGKQSVEGVPFHLLGDKMDCVAAADEPVLVARVGRPVVGIRFLHTLHIAPDEEAALVEAFKNPKTWLGVPAGSYSVRYQDGTVESVPLTYAYNIKRWDIGDRIPHVLKSPGILLGATDAMKKQSEAGRDVCLYTAQWVNPHPERIIDRIELQPGSVGVPVAFAATARAPE